MPLEAGKFFVNLGLTGAEKTLSGLEQVNDHFSGLKGISTEAKLAILGALAGLEQITSMSGKFGNELTKNHQFMNQNIQDMQAYEIATQRAGGATGEMTDTIQDIQKMMNDIWAGKGPREFMPTLMSLMTQSGEKFSPDELKGQIDYWQKNPTDFFKHIVRLSQNKSVDKGRLGYMLQQMGMNPDIMAIARMGGYSDKNMQTARSMTIPDSDIKKLNDLNREFNTFELHMKNIIYLMGTELVGSMKTLNKWAWMADNLMRAKDVQLPKDFASRPVNQGFANIPLPVGGGSQNFQTIVNLMFDGPAPKNAEDMKRVAKKVFHEESKKQKTRTIATATPNVSY